MSRANGLALSGAYSLALSRADGLALSRADGLALSRAYSHGGPRPHIIVVWAAAAAAAVGAYAPGADSVGVPVYFFR